VTSSQRSTPATPSPREGTLVAERLKAKQGRLQGLNYWLHEGEARCWAEVNQEAQAKSHQMLVCSDRGAKGDPDHTIAEGSKEDSDDKSEYKSLKGS
jgi:hypothetical protein